VWLDAKNQDEVIANASVTPIVPNNWVNANLIRSIVSREKVVFSRKHPFGMNISSVFEGLVKKCFWTKPISAWNRYRYIIRAVREFLIGKKNCVRKYSLVIALSKFYDINDNITKYLDSMHFARIHRIGSIMIAFLKISRICNTILLFMSVSSRERNIFLFFYKLPMWSDEVFKTDFYFSAIY